MRHRDDWRPRIQGTNEEFSFCDEYDFCLSVSRSLFDTNARWIIIFHRGSLAVVSLDHLFLIIFWRTMLFLIPRFEKTRNATSRKNEDVSFSLSVCLSLSLARVVAKKSKRHATKAIIAQKKGRTKKRLLSRRLTAAQKKAIVKFARRLKREKKKKRTRANAFCLFYAQFYA